MLNMDCAKDQPFGSKVNVQGKPDLFARLNEDKVVKYFTQKRTRLIIAKINGSFHR